MRQPIMLPVEQPMERKRSRAPAKLGPIAHKSALDDFGSAFDRLDLGFERSRLLARWVVRPAVTRRKLDQSPTGEAVSRCGLGNDLFQDLGVTRRSNRQPVLIVPGREAALLR